MRSLLSIAVLLSALVCRGASIVLQYSGTLTNWQDVGFFKLRLP